MVRSRLIFSAVAFGFAALMVPHFSQAMEDNKPCDITGCSGGGWNGIPGPGPGDPSLDPIANPPNQDDRKLKAADKRADAAEKKREQQAAAKPHPAAKTVIQASSGTVRKVNCGPRTSSSPQCP